MFEQSLDSVLDIVAVFSMALAVIYILKLQKYNANPVMMLFSPLVLYKYLVFLVALVVTFVAVDIVADEVLHDSQMLVYGFEFGLALGSFGIMMITRRLYEQVAHPQKEETKRQIRKNLMRSCGERCSLRTGTLRKRIADQPQTRFILIF